MLILTGSVGASSLCTHGARVLVHDRIFQVKRVRMRMYALWIRSLIHLRWILGQNHG